MKSKKHITKVFIISIITTITMLMCSLPAEARFMRRFRRSHGQQMNAREFSMLAGAIAVLFVIILIIVFVNNKKSGKSSPALTKFNSQDRTQEINKEIIKNDPYFNLSEFLDFSGNMTVKILKAQRAFDYEALKSLESETLFMNSFNALKLKENQFANKNDDKISADIIKLTGYEKTADNELLTASVSCTMSAYPHSPSEAGIKTYLITFEKNKVYSAYDQQNSFCPNCGASVTADILRCNVCGTVLPPDRRDWIVVDFKEI